MKCSLHERWCEDPVEQRKLALAKEVQRIETQAIRRRKPVEDYKKAYKRENVLLVCPRLWPPELSSAKVSMAKSLKPKEPKGDASSSGSRSTAGDNVRNSRELEEALSNAGSLQSESTAESLEDGDVRLSQGPAHCPRRGTLIVSIVRAENIRSQSTNRKFEHLVLPPPSIRCKATFGKKSVFSRKMKPSFHVDIHQQIELPITNECFELRNTRELHLQLDAAGNSPAAKCDSLADEYFNPDAHWQRMLTSGLTIELLDESKGQLKIGYVSISPQMVMKMGHTRETMQFYVYDEFGGIITDQTWAETAVDEAYGIHVASHPAKLTVRLQIKESPPPLGLGVALKQLSGPAPAFSGEGEAQTLQVEVQLEPPATSARTGLHHAEPKKAAIFGEEILLALRQEGETDRDGPKSGKLLVRLLEQYACPKAQWTEHERQHAASQRRAHRLWHPTRMRTIGMGYIDFRDVLEARGQEDISLALLAVNDEGVPGSTFLRCFGATNKKGKGETMQSIQADNSVLEISLRLFYVEPGVRRYAQHPTLGFKLTESVHVDLMELINKDGAPPASDGEGSDDDADSVTGIPKGVKKNFNIADAPKVLSEPPEGEVHVKRGAREEQAKNISLHIGDWDVVGFLRLHGTRTMNEYKLRMHDFKRKDYENLPHSDWLQSTQIWGDHTWNAAEMRAWDAHFASDDGALIYEEPNLHTETQSMTLCESIMHALDPSRLSDLVENASDVKNLIQEAPIDDQWCGVGLKVQVQVQSKQLQVTGLVPDMPAIRSRVIQIGDLIEAIDDVGIEGLEGYRELSRKDVLLFWGRRMMGKANTPITLLFRREGSSQQRGSKFRVKLFRAPLAHQEQQGKSGKGDGDGLPAVQDGDVWMRGLVGGGGDAETAPVN